jgi:hypothetical protein
MPGIVFRISALRFRTQQRTRATRMSLAPQPHNNCLMRFFNGHRYSVVVADTLPKSAGGLAKFLSSASSSPRCKARMLCGFRKAGAADRVMSRRRRRLTRVKPAAGGGAVGGPSRPPRRRRDRIRRDGAARPARRSVARVRVAAVDRTIASTPAPTPSLPSLRRRSDSPDPIAGTLGLTSAIAQEEARRLASARPVLSRSRPYAADGLSASAFIQIGPRCRLADSRSPQQAPVGLLNALGARGISCQGCLARTGGSRL